MGTETTPPPDLEGLNALVDGELSPAERAAVAAKIAADRNFARAHATLARLKSCVIEVAEAAPAAIVTLPAKRSLALPLGLGAVAVFACGLVALVVATVTLPDREPVPVATRDAVITLAGLPANPVVPDLGVAGLKLVDVGIDRSSDVRQLFATYLGPHGCRLDLRVRPAEVAVPPMAGTSRHAWQVDELAYELVAHGMPGWRFAMIAEAAERETRSGRVPDAVDRRLREARAAAPPCAG